MTEYKNKLPGLSPVKRRLINSSVAIDADNPKNVVYQHTVFCQTCLPYRNPGDDVRAWEHRQGNVTLRINAGEAFQSDSQKFAEIGLPFGPKPRIILAYLNSEAVKHQSPIIDIESSLTSFVKRLGFSANGRDIRTLKDQLSRLLSSTITLRMIKENSAIQVNTQVIKTFDIPILQKSNQRILWSPTVQFNDDYFNTLIYHAVPLDERAIVALSHSPIGLDMYAWLAQRLRRITQGEPQFIPWPKLKEQFGRSYSRMHHFKNKFHEVLTQVKTQYPSAKIKLDGRGMILYKSDPPIRDRIFSFDMPTS